MSKVKALLAKYNRPKEKYKGGKILFNPNTKWVEYSLDLLEARKLLQVVDFITKFDIEKVITKIESKINWHEKQITFNINIASRDFQNARRLLGL